jgi:hypothetical protein
LLQLVCSRTLRGRGRNRRHRRPRGRRWFSLSGPLGVLIPHATSVAPAMNPRHVRTGTRTGTRTARPAVCTSVPPPTR